MTLAQFTEECEKRAIAVEVAMEDENIENALLERDDRTVVKLLDTQF